MTRRVYQNTRCYPIKGIINPLWVDAGPFTQRTPHKSFISLNKQLCTCPYLLHFGSGLRSTRREVVVCPAGTGHPPAEVSRLRLCRCSLAVGQRPPPLPGVVLSFSLSINSLLKFSILSRCNVSSSGKFNLFFGPLCPQLHSNTKMLLAEAVNSILITKSVVAVLATLKQKEPCVQFKLFIQ